jgi:hypothetical protein
MITNIAKNEDVAVTYLDSIDDVYTNNAKPFIDYHRPNLLKVEESYASTHNDFK